MDSQEKQSLSPSPPVALADRIDFYSTRFMQWIWSSSPSPGKLTAAFRGLARIILIFSRECQRDKIGLRASALTFTVVLSLVPTLALGTALLKGFGAGDQMREAAYKFIDQMDLTADSPLFTPETLSLENPSTESADRYSLTPSTTPEENLTSHLHRAVDQIFDYVDRTNFARLGAFGIAGLLVAVISVLGSIEHSMNSIWQAKSNRPFARRIMDYLALMILLPISVNLALATETVLQNPEILSRIEFFIPVSGMTKYLMKMIPMFIVVASFTLLYTFLPNTRTRFIPTLIGGLIGGISWVLIQTLYINMQIGVARYNAIYGSFATLPLFLLWIYIGWLVFLGGAEIAFAVQNWRTYTWNETPLTPAARLSIAFRTVSAIQNDFRANAVTDKSTLSTRLNLSTRTVGSVLDQLMEAGIIRHVDGNQNGYVPGSPINELMADEIVELVLGHEPAEHRFSPLAVTALNGAKTAVKGKKVIDSDTT